ncbi:putative helicase MAGATAMA 3 [Sesbania bispinosa]|nr:putative helicase MAGATAMA 3 [Sesbania bispinosa]
MKVYSYQGLRDVFLDYRVKNLMKCFAPTTGWKHNLESMIELLEEPRKQYSLYEKQEAFTMIPTPGWHDLSATCSQQPNAEANDLATEENEGDDEVEDMQQDLDEFERDADGKYIIRPFGKG